MTAYVVHNKIRRDRYSLLMKEIAQQIFHARLMNAVTWCDDPVEGCHRSHKHIVFHEGLMRNKSHLLLMEDDVAFTAPGAFQYFIDNMPKEPFDIYTAGVYGNACKYDNETGLLKKMSGTHCYIIHSRFYQKFMDMNIKEHLDVAISKTAEIIRMCYPMAAMQHPGYSDIVKKEVDYNNPKWIAYPLYKPEVNAST